MDYSTNSLEDVSADSAEFPDRTSSMEVRLQAQEDEITLLKSSLADALRRIRLHDQLLPLLKQQLIAVNPGAARVLNQVYCSDGCSNNRKHSMDRQPTPSHVSNNSSVHSTNGPTAAPVSAEPRTEPSTQDKFTQTEFPLPELETPQTRPMLDLSWGIRSLHLEDGLPHADTNESVESSRAKLHRVAGIDEEEEDGGGEGQDKELGWSSAIEEPIQPTNIRSLQREDYLDCSSSPDEQSPTSTLGRSPDQNQRSAPLSPILEGDKKALARRNSEKLLSDKPRKRLEKKAASSANLLMRSPSLENRAKDLVSNAGDVSLLLTVLVLYMCLDGSRRGTYGQGQSIKMFIRGRPITMYIPSNIHNYEDLKMDTPSERLELDWVYGYRGRDCRANLYFLPTGEAVYFIACVVVLYHINNRTQRHYRKHTDCVRCLTIHPDKVRIASGQAAGVDKDKPLLPCVHIWDSSTLVTLQQIGLGTFQRGVGSVAFSFADSGTFLCVIDDSNEHMLSVWDANKGTKHAEVKSTNEAVFAVEFNPSDSNNIITCGKSHVYFWTLSAGQFTKKQGIFGKYKKPKFIQCFVFSLTGDVLTGDSEGNILTWGKSAADIKTLGKGAKETFQIMRQTKAHEGSVFTLCTLPGGGLLSGGGKDRKIIRWSADLAPERECEIPEKFGAVRTLANVDGVELLVGTTRNAILRGSFSDGFVVIVQGHVDEMWGLATHPTQDVFLSCGNDKQVFLWNAEEHRMDWCTTLEEYGLCADFSPVGSVVSIGLSTGRWLVMDLLTRKVVSESTDGNEQLSVMRYSPDGSFLAVGSHDNFIYIYSVAENGRRYSRFGKCNGHSSFITHLDWSKDGKYIMSNSGDYEILYWDIAGGCKLLRNRYESKDREWASYTCVLGFHVMGVWLEGSDGTDINALCRSHSERVVAVADDFCKVHLFQYPCPKPKAPSRKYEGHGSHVTNVCFTYNDSHLLSMGGKDTCILQWKIQRVGDSRERLASLSSTSTSSPEPTVS
ncbi:echinoderm microtubule-associated protein-like 4 [Periophthalmus magnuspinnatus]|uniref:echinoderm microtubule-associated protein-like 4 n=1 Tax=Periophthalmus magnuspinnatus TaxID=409849 RepID=UPI002436DF80|nr:echinoderm microtubule-associated protein-like 4 [Periophthalmus magnuspinnatus]